MSPAILRRRELLLAGGLLLALPAGAMARPVTTPRLALKNANTGETFTGPYRDATGPIPSAIADLAKLLRDHHVNKAGPVDLATLDFLAEVMAAIGQTNATILSGFRTPATNAKLIKLGAAEHSQHLVGRAIDVTFDRRLPEAEKAARELQRGGVGWYPQSRFLHLDSGPVRYWQGAGLNLLDLLAGRAKPKGRPTTVAERQALHKQLARRQFLARQK
jgi:uncharacterized protein YcbK (DUF882 family)